MQAERTKVHLVHAAMLELGLPPRYAVDDPTDQGAVIDIQFDRCLARCFGLHDWSFCRRTSKLTRQTATPDTGYQYAFDLPGDLIGVPLKVLDNSRSQHPVRYYRLEAGALHCDCADIWIVAKVKLDPRNWDDQFADLFCVALASMLAIPLIQDAELAAGLEKQVFRTPGQGFPRLIAQHKAGEPVGAGLYADDPLTAAHDGGRWSGRI